MIDVFISYSQTDRAVAQEVADALKSRDFSVWFDASLLPGESFAKVILEKVDEAKKVIVLWSSRSIRSEWVIAESYRAYDAGKLIPILLPGLTIGDVPIPFGMLHSLSWKGQASIPELERALRQSDTEIGKSDPVKDDTPYATRPKADRVRVFIAHASSDKSRLSGPLSIIIDMGFKVWIDKPEELDIAPALQRKLSLERIHYGQDWQYRISEAVKRADCVLAFWSRDAIRGRSQQFYYELYMGLVQKKLIQCRIDSVPIDEIGMPYTFHHIADLSKFTVGRFSLALDQLMEDLAERRRRWLFGMLG